MLRRTGYHASIEAELPDGLTPEQIKSRIHDTFELVRTSVESELRNGNHRSADRHASAAPTPQPLVPNQMASGKQVKFLIDLALRSGMDNI